MKTRMWMFIILFLHLPRPSWLPCFHLPPRLQADVAPPQKPPAVNPSPGKEPTQVRMVSETVTLEILPNKSADALGSASVTASFNMHNLGNSDEEWMYASPDILEWGQ